MNDRVLSVAVIMQRSPSTNRWASERWEVHGVIPDPGGGDGAPRVILDDGSVRQVLHPGFTLELFRSEREGYYLNVSSPDPCAFVMLRNAEGEPPVPSFVTLSYNEAARWMDGGETVETVALAPELRRWLGEFVEEHYRPEPKFVRKRT